MNIKEPTGHLARWALLLQQQDFTIQHRSGPTNGHADALSRRPYDSVLAALDKPGLQIERVKELQRMDPSLVDIINYFETERLPNNSSVARAIIHTVFRATSGCQKGDVFQVLSPSWLYQPR